ncbi:TetR/AcrR family transcriptional regulator [Streptomyces sp. SID11385]|uniref:TetR/AcrR family transcriptional regulator n=1 Tax=Streptomyces sp. SID11385 TaxID=2706031 RepID=UPI0013CB6932|nr:TetR/AcrR family transcriptional regulator [Streptomyces sp. SID11385]NEA42365.1 TetR/AcrR family transcriptional regulator [Streptomyces sp. SID11385]
MPTNAPGAKPPRLTPKGRATRERIVAAAARLMTRQGVGATTLEQVREAAEVSGSQVYHYFDGKQDLVRAVVAYTRGDVLDMQQPLLSRLDSLAGLRAWRDGIVAHQRSLGCRGGCPLGALGAEVAEHDAFARGLVAEAFDQWEDEIRAGLRAMHSRGEFTPGTDPDALALALLSALQGGLLLTQIQRKTLPLETALDTTLAYIGTRMRE